MPDASTTPRSWADRAEEDFSIATHEMKRGSQAPFGGVCFHAQQCVEKYLKAVLLLHGVDFPKVHDLEALLALVPGSAKLTLTADDVLPLNRYSVEGRYPGNWEPISQKEAEEAVALMRRLRDAIRIALPGSS